MSGCSKTPPREEVDRRVDEALERVGLAPKIGVARSRQLSGGQAQRVAIARAIVDPPGLLLADEPTSSLDVSLRAVILNLLNELRRDLGLAILFVTHDLAAARIVADRIVVMQGGRIVESGTCGCGLRPSDTTSTRTTPRRVARARTERSRRPTWLPEMS